MVERKAITAGTDSQAQSPVAGHLYSPRIADELIHPLWLLAQERHVPMTHLVRDAVQQYLTAPALTDVTDDMVILLPDGTVAIGNMRVAQIEVADHIRLVLLNMMDDPDPGPEIREVEGGVMIEGEFHRIGLDFCEPLAYTVQAVKRADSGGLLGQPA
jgi:hypothetical protein